MEISSPFEVRGLHLKYIVEMANNPRKAINEIMENAHPQAGWDFTPHAVFTFKEIVSNPQRPVRLIAGADTICQLCNRRSSQYCQSAAMKDLDRKHISKLRQYRIKPGSTVPAGLLVVALKTIAREKSQRDQALVCAG